jgi:hypothetical protein
MRKPISGQFKVNLDTGQVSIVGSKASDRPVKEQQASVLQWGEDREKLERWQGMPGLRMMVVEDSWWVNVGEQCHGGSWPCCSWLRTEDRL